MLSGSPALPAAVGAAAPHPPLPPSRRLPTPAAASKAKSRFDIESLLAKPEPPRRAPLLPSARAAASPPALAVGCLVAGTLPFPTLYLTAQQRSLSGPNCWCAAPDCKRPGPGLEFSHCSASLRAPPSWRPGVPCKTKRVRTVFTPEQLERLEKEFVKQQYMVGSERVDLAATLQLTETQVKVWFQNRRIKWRKQSLDQKAAKLSQFGTRQMHSPHPLDGQDNDREGEVDLEV